MAMSSQNSWNPEIEPIEIPRQNAQVNPAATPFGLELGSGEGKGSGGDKVSGLPAGGEFELLALTILSILNAFDRSELSRLIPQNEIPSTRMFPIEGPVHRNSNMAAPAKMPDAEFEILTQILANILDTFDKGGPDKTLLSRLSQQPRIQNSLLSQPADAEHPLPLLKSALLPIAKIETESSEPAIESKVKNKPVDRLDDNKVGSRSVTPSSPEPSFVGMIVGFFGFIFGSSPQPQNATVAKQAGLNPVPPAISSIGLGSMRSRSSSMALTFISLALAVLAVGVLLLVFPETRSIGLLTGLSAFVVFSTALLSRLFRRR